jgi:hypothetical protein
VAGVITFTPDTNFTTGVVTIPYIISDGQGGTATANEIITVTPVNDPPVDPDDTNTVTEDTPLTVAAAAGLLVGATDPEGNALTITGYTIDGISGAQIVGTPVAIAGVGVLTINADGGYSFVPAANYTGAIPVATYTISDGNGGTDTSTLTLTITPVDDVFTDNNESVSTPKNISRTGNVIDSGLTSGDGRITLTDFSVDIDNDGVPETFIAGQTATIVGVGILTIANDGAYTFTPANNYGGIVPTVTYSLSDDGGATVGDTSTLDIVMRVTNDPPVAVDDTYTVAEEGTVTLTPLAADTDVDNDT